MSEDNREHSIESPQLLQHGGGKPGSESQKLVASETFQARECTPQPRRAVEEPFRHKLFQAMNCTRDAFERMRREPGCVETHLHSLIDKLKDLLPRDDVEMIALSWNSDQVKSMISVALSDHRNIASLITTFNGFDWRYMKESFVVVIWLYWPSEAEPSLLDTTDNFMASWRDYISEKALMTPVTRMAPAKELTLPAPTQAYVQPAHPKPQLILAPIVQTEACPQRVSAPTVLNQFSADAASFQDEQLDPRIPTQDKFAGMTQAVRDKIGDTPKQLVNIKILEIPSGLFSLPMSPTFMGEIPGSKEAKTCSHDATTKLKDAGLYQKFDPSY